jgi:MOSC domain-containing protein YiiM
MILNLFTKCERRAPMVPVEILSVNTGGVVGAVHAAPIRHVLIVPRSILEEFGIQAGELRENIVIDDRALGDLHALPSGTVLALGDVRVRLTFHCEPCPRVGHLVSSFKVLKNRRGYLATVMNEGVLHVGDSVSSLGVQYEAIPHELTDRAAWYLDQQRAPVPVKRFVYDIGLSMSYCRAVPGLLKKLSGATGKVVFGGGAGAGAKAEPVGGESDDEASYSLTG